MDKIVHQYQFEYQYMNVLGYMAIVCSEKAKVGEAGTAICRDELGHIHTIAIEPEQGELKQGEEIILVAAQKEYYIARKTTPSASLF